MNVSKNYDIRELVHPAIIDSYGVTRVAKYIKKYSPLMVDGQQTLREFVGAPCTVNNYHWNSEYKKGGWDAIKDNKVLLRQLRINSGLRDMRNPLNNGFSGHFFMCCTDSIQDKYSSIELQNLILEESRQHPYIVRLEDANYTNGWNHVQYGYRFPNQQIDVYKP